MAEFVKNNLLRIIISTLNFVSPSVFADILLHPFDFATVLLHIGFDPEGVKNESTALVSVILQYALFTFYIPYLLTSIQDLQFMGMPHPSIFYYVNYIYNKEGFMGCYRGLLLKICERLIMVGVSERVKKSLHKGISVKADSSRSSSEETQQGSDEGNFAESLINNVCSQFFAVVVSHPFHVLMVTSFAEFTYNRNSSILQLLRSAYAEDGCLGFFTGLTARLLGEILSLIFSTTYTAIINKQSRPQQETVAFRQFPSSQKNSHHLVNYVTNMSRFTALKPSAFEEDGSAETPLLEELPQLNGEIPENEQTGYMNTFINFLKNNAFGRNIGTGLGTPVWRPFAFLDFVPFTSKIFYYIMIRDYLSKKISNPFFLVSHCTIILGSGWDKFPIAIYLRSSFELLFPDRIPAKSAKLTRKKNYP